MGGLKKGETMTAELLAQLKANATAAGLDWGAIIKGLTRMLPVMETISKLTPTPYDDMFVAFLRTLLVPPTA